MSAAHTLIDFPPLARHLERAQDEVREALEARVREVPPETPVAGFTFGGAHAGVKRDPALLDLGLIIAEQGAACAGVYTQNLVVAAPVTLSRAHLAASPRARAVVVNSGNANACTGESGARHAAQVAARVADLTSNSDVPVTSSEVQVASTGVIGAPLPVNVILNALDGLKESCAPDHLPRFATSIMTTDNRPKARALELDLTGVEGAAGTSRVTISGCSKGAGMIHPNMATMLAYLCTDAPVSSAQLQPMWRRVCDQSFNAITIDGDTSTNDTALCLASGAARPEDAVSSDAELTGEAARLFESALLALAQALAVDILRDGEGVEHVARLTISGARSTEEARQVAETIGLSPLVKTAMNGCDPNWGRVIAAVGRSGVHIEPARLSLTIGDALIFDRGEWRGLDAERVAHDAMTLAEYDISVDLGLGDIAFTLFMSDLSANYVKINADYRS